MVGNLVQAGFYHFQPAQVGLHTHYGLVHQQHISQFAPGIGFRSLGSQAVQFLVQAGPLGVKHSLRLALPGSQAQQQFEVELILLVFAGHWLGEPGLQGLLPGLGNRIDDFFRAAILGHRLLGYQAALLQPGQRRIDLGRFEIPVLFPAHHGLKSGVQFITMSRALGQKSKQRVSDRHKY